MSTQPNDCRTQFNDGGVGPVEPDHRQPRQPAATTFSQAAPGPVRSCTSAGSTASPQIRPSVSTRMCRLHRPIFFPRVVPPGSAGLGRLDGLAVDDAGGGRRLAAGAGAGVAAPGRRGPRPQAAVAPGLELVGRQPQGGKSWGNSRQAGPRCGRCTGRR